MIGFPKGPLQVDSENARRGSEASQDTIDLLQQEDDVFTASTIVPNVLLRNRLVKIATASLVLVCIVVLIPVAIYHGIGARSGPGRHLMPNDDLSIKINAFGPGETTPLERVSATIGRHLLEVEDTPRPTPNPTPEPTHAPTQRPSTNPTQAPTNFPTTAPSSIPSSAPTSVPSQAPSGSPTESPTQSPTNAPTDMPSKRPTLPPTLVTTHPTSLPTASPTRQHYGHYELSEQIDNDMKKHYREHDPYCQRALIYQTRHMYGLGSQWNCMLLAFVTSLWESRALVMEDSWMVDYRCNDDRTEGTYASCFKSFVIGPSTCDVKRLREKAKNFTDYPIWNCTHSAPFVCKEGASPVVYSHGIMYHGGYHVFKNEKGDLLTKIGDHEYLYFDLEVYAMKHLWNLKDDVQQQVNAWIDKVGLEGTVCGFHVRRGDKVSGGTAEALKQDLPSYLIQAQRSGLKCDTCFFSSDDMTGVLEEVDANIHKYLPGCKVKSINFKPLTEGGYQWFKFRRSETDVIIEQTLQFLAAIEVFSRRTHFFVGTFSSNVGRLIAVLRSARGWHPGTSASVDTPHWYFRRHLVGNETHVFEDEEIDFDYPSRRNRARTLQN